jgi:hypothetical protein
MLREVGKNPSMGNFPLILNGDEKDRWYLIFRCFKTYWKSLTKITNEAFVDVVGDIGVSFSYYEMMGYIAQGDLTIRNITGPPKDASGKPARRFVWRV